MSYLFNSFFQTKDLNLEEEFCLVFRNNLEKVGPLIITAENFWTIEANLDGNGRTRSNEGNGYANFPNFGQVLYII